MAVSTKRKNSLKSKSNSKTRKQFKKFRKTDMITKKIRGGGGGDNMKVNNNNILDYINRQVSIPILKNIDNYTYVGMSDMKESPGPLATDSLFTCMGVGTHIDGINYLAHLSPNQFSDSNNSLLEEWKQLLTTNKHKIENIYIYMNQKITKETQPFFKMINKLGLIDKIFFVDTTIYINSENRFLYPADKYVIGISKDGPWWYNEEEYKYKTQFEEEKLEIQELKNKFLNKTVKIKDSNDKNTYKVIDFNWLQNPICELIENNNKSNKSYKTIKKSFTIYDLILEDCYAIKNKSIELNDENKELCENTCNFNILHPRKGKFYCSKTKKNKINKSFV